MVRWSENAARLPGGLFPQSFSRMRFPSCRVPVHLPWDALSGRRHVRKLRCRRGCFLAGVPAHLRPCVRTWGRRRVAIEAIPRVHVLPIRPPASSPGGFLFPGRPGPLAVGTGWRQVAALDLNRDPTDEAMRRPLRRRLPPSPVRPFGVRVSPCLPRRGLAVRDGIRRRRCQPFRPAHLAAAARTPFIPGTVLNPNPPMDRDGRGEDTGRGERK